MGKGCKDTCVPFNIHHKVMSAEEFSNQVDRITHSVNSQPPSSAIPIISQWAHEQSSHGGRDEVLQGLNNVNVTHQG